MLPAESLKETMVIAVHFKDFDGFVGGAGLFHPLAYWGSKG